MINLLNETPNQSISESMAYNHCYLQIYYASKLRTNSTFHAQVWSNRHTIRHLRYHGIRPRWRTFWFYCIKGYTASRWSPTVFPSGFNDLPFAHCLPPHRLYDATWNVSNFCSWFTAFFTSYTRILFVCVYMCVCIYLFVR